MDDDYEYEYALVNVENDVQDTSSKAWQKLCEYVDKIAEEGGEKFDPLEYLGKELYAQVYTLPSSIVKLKKVKEVRLYGSRLKRVPPEIGEMESLEVFYPYTSYDLHWLPYEITKCPIKYTCVSIRALYGNYKYRKPFPDLQDNPVRYGSDFLKCSVCQKTITYQETNQLWISLDIGYNVLPLLVNLCSKTCEEQLPLPAYDYIQHAHKGGIDLIQPPEED